MKTTIWIVAETEEVEAPIAKSIVGNRLDLYVLSGSNIIGIFEDQDKALQVLRDKPAASIWRYDIEATCIRVSE